MKNRGVSPALLIRTGWKAFATAEELFVAETDRAQIKRQAPGLPSEKLKTKN